jgi:hypothetical protein
VINIGPIKWQTCDKYMSNHGTYIRHVTSEILQPWVTGVRHRTALKFVKKKLVFYN